MRKCAVSWRNIMRLSYNNLWKTLIDKEIKKGELCKRTGISSSTISKMNRNEPVSLAIVLKICETLECSIENVVTVVENGSEV